MKRPITPVPIQPSLVVDRLIGSVVVVSMERWRRKEEEGGGVE